MSDQASSALAFAKALTARSNGWTPSHRAFTVARAYKLQTITPMWGGGVSAGKVDEAFPVRGKSIKGRWRRWWRILKLDDQAQHLLTKEERDQGVSPEARLFGGALTTDGTLQPLLKVRVALVGSAQPTQQLQDAATRVGYVWRVFGGGQCLGPGLQFRISVEIHAQPEESGKQWLDLLNEAVRFWANFGGVGGRNSRGLGRVAPFDGDTGRWLYPVSVEQAQNTGCELTTIKFRGSHLQRAMDAWAFAISVLQHYRQGHDAKFVFDYLWKVSCPENADVPFHRWLSFLGEDYRRAHNGVDLCFSVRPHGDLYSRSYRPGRSKWPEAETLRGAVAERQAEARWAVPLIDDPDREVPARGVFPRASLGLPIICNQLKPAHQHGNGGDVGKFRIELAGTGSKLKSPVLVGVRKSSDVAWEAFALALPSEFRQQALSTRVKVLWTPVKNRANRNAGYLQDEGHEKELDLGEFPVWEASRALSVLPMRTLAPGSSDPISAFLEFFRSQSGP